MYEQSPWGVIVPFAVVASTAAISGIYTQTKVEQVEREDANARVERVQQYNAQLMPQLMEVSPGVMGTVTIKDQDETFSFNIRNNGQTETCTGEYDVEDEVATVAGSIVCSQTTLIAK